MSTEISRKKKLRGAHRASATRLQKTVSELLVSFDPNKSEEFMPRLNQLKTSMQEKLKILSTLDEEILNVIDEVNIDDEIAQSDVCREDLQLALENIERVIRTISLPSTPTVSTDTPSAISQMPTSPQQSNASTSQPGTSNEHELPDLGHSSTSTVSYTQSTEYPSTPPATAPQENLGGHPPIQPNNHVSQVKLPKLILKKFSGDPSQWNPFWDTFETSIHTNPSLAPIDKFNYLKSLMDGAAAESIAGLSLTNANYEEAIAVLKSRFGNKQQIINRHMDILLNLPSVSSENNLKGLRQLYDTVQSHIRSLKSMGVATESYGSLLSSMLMSKLPTSLQLVVSRIVKENEWNLDKLLDTFQQELEARERITGTATNRDSKRYYGSASALTTGSNPTCTYCRGSHPSRNCTTVKDPTARQDILRKTGRCFVCLRKDHISPNCKSTVRCYSCKGRHHVSICKGKKQSPDRSKEQEQVEAKKPPPPNEGAGSRDQSDSTVCHTTMSNCILLQTARATIYNPDNPDGPKVKARLILDGGSQCSYVSSKLRETIGLEPKSQGSVTIKTFGSSETNPQVIDVVNLGIKAVYGSDIEVSAFVVPLICQPLKNQFVSNASKTYSYLSNLHLADYLSGQDDAEVDILIGSDHYWKIVTGKTKKGEGGPTAIQTKLGWVLSGPVGENSPHVNHMSNLATIHTLKCASDEVKSKDDVLVQELKKFWDLETLGIQPQCVYEEFLESIRYEDNHYVVNLPWRPDHAELPDNYDLSKRRLLGLLKRLRNEPDILKEYDNVIRDQLNKGIVESVPERNEGSKRTHYLPHHAVIRQDKATTKLRVVYDASAKSMGPSLNDCLYSGPSLTQNIVDIMLRFRAHKVALTRDIEKAFLMIHVAESDRDALRFLWVDDIHSPNPKIIQLRFTRVVFGVSSSPFLLNATVKHHIERYKKEDPSFVETIQNSIYVDDLISGGVDVEETFKLYEDSKSRLAEANFNLRKISTNSKELQDKVCQLNQTVTVNNSTNGANSNSCQQLVLEEQSSYTGSTLGPPLPTSDDKQKVLGTLWDSNKDNLVIDIKDVADLAQEVQATKRNVISVSSKIYDPMGFISPLTVNLKLMFQELCLAKGDWDHPLEGTLKLKWLKLVKSLKEVRPIVIPRCYLSNIREEVVAYELHGFCDASIKAYAAVIYLRVITSHACYARLVISKARVAPLTKQTIPRLELLSALVLARLISVTEGALKSVIEISKVKCWTDSKVALYWITQQEKEWKQYVQSRVEEIRRLVPVEHWAHCPGAENPADIPSRGILPTQLASSELWWSGPNWLISREDPTKGSASFDLMPNECRNEMKVKDKRALDKETLSTLVVHGSKNSLSNVINCKDYNSLDRLLRVTAIVFKFVNLLKSRVKLGEPTTIAELTITDIELAQVLWIKELQSEMKGNEKFESWNRDLNLLADEDGILRCKGRLSNSNLSYSAKFPILLDAAHHLTTLIVWSCHGRVMHGGVKETLTELRSKFWLVRGRNFVRRLIFKCVICKKQDGRPYKALSSPPLPEFRVKEAPPFTYVGLDYVGPLYVKPTNELDEKAWICLITCCVSRAVHFEVVPNMTTQAFLRCFRRFTARRSTPLLVISDNAKTFKAASKELRALMNDPQVKKYFWQQRTKWSFNLEKAPWWGGFFERLVGSLKRCLKKTIGRAKLSYEELVTVVTEAESILTSRPLSYVSSEDVEEPLTPAHLLSGRRILSLPDHYRERITDEDFEFDLSTNDLCKRVRYLNTVIDHFWQRWRNEYLAELRNAHKGSKKTVEKAEVEVGDIVLVHDENHPRSFWRIGRIKNLVSSTGGDGQSRGAVVQVTSKGGKVTALRRPLQLLYPLEINCKLTEESEEVNDVQEPTESARPRRRSAIAGEQLIKHWIKDMNEVE